MPRADYPGLFIAASVLSVLATPPSAPAGKYVIQISVDGLRPADTTDLINLGLLPNFERLISEGASTGNARTDQTRSLPFDFFGFEKLVQTLPNHTSMMTSRPIERNNSLGNEVGHGYTSNDDAQPTENIHTFGGPLAYKASTFDVAHDLGLRTGLFASKDKFQVFENSYSTAGAPDTVGPDNGTDKIDVFVYNGNSAQLVTNMIAEMQANPMQYVFLHFRDPDSAGHSSDWGSQQYDDAIRAVDASMGQIFAMIDGTPLLAGRTNIILTADHGGAGVLADSHVRYDTLLDTRIPLYVWGPGVSRGADLYMLNAGIRVNPGSTAEISLTNPNQPLRSGDTGNLAMQLLGLPAIPGSVYNAAQNLVVGQPCPLDLNGDSLIDDSDLGVILANYGCQGVACIGDFNENGATDDADLGLLLASFGTACQ